MEAGRESRVSGEVAAYSDARTSVIATSPSSELRPLMPNFAQQQFRAEHVSVGSKADLTASKCDFRYTPESGLKSDIAPCPKSAKGRHHACCHNSRSADW